MALNPVSSIGDAMRVYTEQSRQERLAPQGSDVEARAQQVREQPVSRRQEEDEAAERARQRREETAAVNEAGGRLDLYA